MKSVPLILLAAPILLVYVVVALIFIFAGKMQRKFRVLFVTLSVLLILSVSVTTLAVRVHRQFGADMEYTKAAGYVIPNGVWYNFDVTNATERFWLKTFYLGEEIDTQTIPLFQPYEADNDFSNMYRFYHVRGRDSLGTIIREEMVHGTYFGKETTFSRFSILRAARFTTYCVNHKLPHEDIFGTIMEKVYSCQGAEDISAIRVEARSDAADGGQVKPLTITDRDSISEIWAILLDSAYYHDSGIACTYHSPAEPREISSTGTTRAQSADAVRRVILEFTDGSDFQFSFYNAETMVMTFEHTADDAYMKTEALYPTAEANARLMELFGISQ